MKSTLSNTLNCVNKYVIDKDICMEFDDKSLSVLGAWPLTFVSRLMKVECFDWDKDGGHDLIGVFSTTMRELTRGPGDFNTYEVGVLGCVGVMATVIRIKMAA